ncbi:MAG TPA: T9SS type A sorting domain-containing protein, partial [Chitinophagaceae bacterium]
RRDFAAIQLNANGTLDNSFSGDGRVLTDVGNEFDIVKCLAVQPDGKILVGGKTEALDLPSRRDQFAIVRYNDDGTLDNSFSGDGIVVTGFGVTNCHVTALAVQPDGKIIAGGITDPYGNTDFALARYNADGTLDLTFDGDGLVTTDINIRDWITDIALQPDGKIVASGLSYSAQNWNDFVAARYNPDGSLDNTFSGDGKLVYDAASNTEMATGLALQANGKIIIGGYITGQYDQDFLLVRFNADGTTDNSFATNGKLIMDMGYGNDRIESLNIWDQRLYAVGGSVYGGEMGTVAAFSIIGCSINVAIPDASTLSNGVLPNTVYVGYGPASDITLMAQPSDGIAPYSYSWSNGATTSSITIMPTIATTYTVVVTDAAGCTSSVSKLVNVIDTRCGNKMDKVLICQVPPGNPSNARTVCVDASAVAAHLNTGSYLGSCVPDLTTMATRSNSPLEETSVRLDIYPNPGISQFNVMLKTTAIATGDLVVRDVMGRVVERRKISTNELIKIGASYPAGVYVVEVMSGSSKWSARLIKQR